MSENKHTPVPTDIHSPFNACMYRGHCKEIEKQLNELLASLGTQATKDVIAERQRQITAEGWTPEHDDQHEIGQLAEAAACYAANAGGWAWIGGWPGEVWPWDREWWKPTTPRRDLVKSAALILAEIERLDRAECHHDNEIRQHTGDETPVDFCPDCGRNKVAGSAPESSSAPAIVFYPAGSLGESVELEGGEA